MNLRLLGLSGAALLAIGLFTPIVSVPIFGNVNLFNNGSNWSAVILLILAALSALLVITDREQTVIWPGAAATAALVFLFGKLQYGLSEMRDAATKALADNPFAGLAQAAIGSIQLQWGWLVLAIGAGLIVYAGVSARRKSEQPLFDTSDPPVKAVAALSALLLIVLVAVDLLTHSSGEKVDAPVGKVEGALRNDVAASPETTASKPSQEEADYIRNHLRLYDLEAKYYDSMLDGRVPGVDFKIQNNGNRTLNGVTVRVVFQDKDGRPIAEEEYNPVLVSEYNFSGDNKPLRPNYIWQNESGQFYTAKSVPSEWSAGKATASITDIEFAPKE